MTFNFQTFGYARNECFLLIGCEWCSWLVQTGVKNTGCCRGWESAWYRRRICQCWPNWGLSCWRIRLLNILVLLIILLILSYWWLWKIIIWFSSIFSTLTPRCVTYIRHGDIWNPQRVLCSWLEFVQSCREEIKVRGNMCVEVARIERERERVRIGPFTAWSVKRVCTYLWPPGY